MPRIRIEMDRGAGWELRAEGDVALGKNSADCCLTGSAAICPACMGDDIAAQVRADLPRYAVQYPHRGFLDGVLVGEVQPVRRCRRR
jgi:hypothetical protein